MRRLTLPLASALLITPLVLAHAEPVGQARLAQAEFMLSDTDGAAQKIRLTVTNATRPRLTLQVSECDAAGCTGFEYYETRLNPTAVSIDDTTAAGELTTSLGGKRLHIVWTPDDRLVVKGGVEGDSGDSGETLSAYRTDPAIAKISFDGDRCSGAAGVGDEVRVEMPDGTTGAARPLESFRTQRRLGCGAS